MQLATNPFLASVHKVIKKFNHIKLSTPAAIIVAACILGISHIGYAYVIRSSSPSTKENIFGGKQIDKTDYVYGKKDASVIVIEYSDPECPFCVKLHPIIKDIKEKYKDKVAFVYRHFPLTQIHKHAYDEARAIACAGRVNGEKGFYEYLNNLFDYKSANKTSELPLNGTNDIAKNIGLDIQKFSSCMDKEDTGQEVIDEQADGLNAGVQGTPTTFVLVKTKNGYDTVALIDGARGEASFTAAIEEALSR
jgi:protein-disulfide isomerase